MYVGSGESITHVFPWEVINRLVWWGKKQRCFPVCALPHLSMLLGLWHRRLSWCPRCYYFCTWEVKHSALIPPGGACSSLSPLLPQLPVSLRWWSSGKPLSSASLGKNRVGALLCIHCWAGEEIHFNCVGASQLKAEFPFFQRRCSISSWRSKNSVWVLFCLAIAWSWGRA